MRELPIVSSLPYLSKPVVSNHNPIQTLPSGHQLLPQEDFWIIPSHIPENTPYQKGKVAALTEVYPGNETKARNIFGQWKQFIQKLYEDRSKRREIEQDLSHAENEWLMPSTARRLTALRQMQKIAHENEIESKITPGLKKAEELIVDSQFSLNVPSDSLYPQRMSIQARKLDEAGRQLTEVKNPFSIFSDRFNSRIQPIRDTLTQKLDQTLRQAQTLGEKVGKEEVSTKHAEQQLADAYAILRSREPKAEGYRGWGEGLTHLRANSATKLQRTKEKQALSSSTSLEKIPNLPDKKIKN
jgi:hypothetical protein